jgi:hypothetical protein
VRGKLPEDVRAAVVRGVQMSSREEIAHVSFLNRIERHAQSLWSSVTNGSSHPGDGDHGLQPSYFTGAQRQPRPDPRAAAEPFQHYADGPAPGVGKPPAPLSHEELAYFLE